MIPPVIPLPIDDALPALRAALRAHAAAVLEAPPGAGKTTRVPLALLGEPWIGGRGIVMLEPRRLAARAAARRMAETLGEGVGQTVGYRVRNERHVSAATRIEVVTEGILTRRLQGDPGLAGVGLVVFDEFHERSLHADLGLALVLQTQALFRPELRVLVMSATLDGAPVAALLGDVPVVSSHGRAFPVDVRHAAREPEGRPEAVVAAAVRRALDEVEGDVLAFLPGEGEIRRAENLLGGVPADVHPLYGALPPEAQDRALRPSPPGRRRVVLATTIAQTSLTIEGARAVVDGGWTRAPRFSPRTGMTELATVRVSQASAKQRAGRAGRLAPGVAYRTWTAATHARLDPFDTPEIQQADLAPLALELAVWGAAPDELAFLDPPPEAAFEQARDLLRGLGALDRAGNVTEHGRAMARLGLHPRLAHLVLEGRRLGHGPTACRVAALLGERDPLRAATGPATGPTPADLRLRLDALATGQRVHGLDVHRGALARVRQDAGRLARRLGLDAGARGDAHAAGLLVALAYPDRVGQAVAPGRFRLTTGRAAHVDDTDPLAEAGFLACAALDGRGGAGRVFLAAPLSADDIERAFADDVETAEEVVWDAAAERVVARRVRRLGAVVLHEARLQEPPAEAAAALLLGEVRRRGLAALPWTKAAQQLRERLAFLGRLEGERWPDVSDEALLASLDAWLGPALAGKSRWSDVERLDLQGLLLGTAGWAERADLDRLAPTHHTVPTGSRLPIDYADPEAPVLAVRLQEVFGERETPRVGGGRVPLTLHLLSPAHRPVQVTRDLAGFWAGSYADVRKDMRGRYPKHPWPEDPASAEPTRRAKPRG